MPDLSKDIDRAISDTLRNHGRATGFRLTKYTLSGHVREALRIAYLQGVVDTMIAHHIPPFNNRTEDDDA